MKKARNLFVFWALVVVMVAALVVSTAAYIGWDEETSSFPGGSKSQYKDINKSGWVQVAGVEASDADSDGDYVEEGDLVKGNGTFNAYFNESSGTVVVECVSGALTGNYNDQNKAELFAYWAKANADKVTSIELRNVTAITNPGYVLSQLTKAKVVKVESGLKRWNGSRPATALFYGLSSFDTLYFGEWDKETGDYIVTLGKENEVNLGGFECLKPVSGTANGNHPLYLLDGAVQGSGVKKVILPAVFDVYDTKYTYVDIVVSDGTFVDAISGSIIAKDKPCTVLVHQTTGEIGYTTSTSITSDWSKKLVKATEDLYGGEYTGIISYRFAYNAKSLAVVEVPANVTLKHIGAEAFSGCTALELIDVKGVVSADMSIENSNAFESVSNLTIKVYSQLDKTYMERALTAAGVTGVTVVAEQKPEQEQSNLENAIVSQGFSARMKEYTGLRALFSFDVEVEAKNNENGYTLVSYGVFTTSYKNFVENYGSSDDILFAAAREVEDNTGSKVKYVPVYNDDGHGGSNGVNRYVDYATRTFCISLTNISSANALADIYMAGYAIWRDADYNEYYTITTYDMADGEKAVNLYEITLGLTKSGIINSENTDDICFWQTLQVGALKTDSFNTAYDDVVTKGYSLTDGYYTYLDVDWHAFTGNDTPNAYGYKATGVDTNASGVVWSVLKYTEDEYVLVIRNKDKESYSSLMMPWYTAAETQYWLYAPYDYRYGSDAKRSCLPGTDMVTYNPALTQADYEKIKTMVVDYGITSTDHSAFAGLTAVETIVYPNGLSGAGDYKFVGSTSVKNVIWCHTDDNGNPVEHVLEFESLISLDGGNVIKEPLFDLRGLAGLSNTQVFRKASGVENIVLPASFVAGSTNSTFMGTTSLSRVWVEGNAVPEAGVIDLSKLKITKLQRAEFDVGDRIHTIKLPDTITSIAHSTNTSAEYSRILGNGKEIDYICSDSVATIIAEYVAFTHTKSHTYADKITVNGKSVLTLIQELAQ